jgi:hypothetical protein
VLINLDKENFMATTKQKAVLADVLSQVDTLSTRHDLYVEQFVTRANDELYAMLSEMMRVREDISSSGCEDYLVKSLRRTLSERWDIKTQKNTSTTALVVRYITRGNRQLTHNYARTIDTAIAAGVTSATLVDYIKQQGSIDALRKKSADKVQQQQLALQARTMQENLAGYLVANKRIGTIDFAHASGGILAGAVDCKFNVSLTAWIGDEERVVASIYPCSFIVDYCLGLYKLACEAAAMDDGSGKFYEFCKANSLNMDIVHRWMRDNNIASPADAKNLARAIYGHEPEQAPASETAANEVYALTA